VESILPLVTTSMRFVPTCLGSGDITVIPSYDVPKQVAGAVVIGHRIAAAAEFAMAASLVSWPASTCFCRPAAMLRAMSTIAWVCSIRAFSISRCIR